MRKYAGIIEQDIKTYPVAASHRVVPAFRWSSVGWRGGSMTPVPDRRGLPIEINAAQRTRFVLR
jgi:hypothetical protein